MNGETVVELRAGAAEYAARNPARTISMPHCVVALIVLDLIAAIVAAPLATCIRFGYSPSTLRDPSYFLLASTLPPTWIVLMALAGTYRQRFLAAGPEEFRRVWNGGVRLLALIAIASFLSHSDASRGVIVMTVPLVIALTLLGRYAARRWLHRTVRSGRPIYRVLAVGARPAVDGLIRHMSRAPHAGFSIVGVCLTGADAENGAGLTVPVTGNVDRLLEAVHMVSADTIAIAGPGELHNNALRRLSWELESTDVNLIVAPAITDIAGPRIRVRPIDGLPLLHVEQPRYSGTQRLMKEAFDLLGAAMGLIILALPLIVIALLIKLTSRGPVLFRQPRVGVHGHGFTLWKFRTMRVGADDELQGLVSDAQHDGILFKLQYDPRITGVGRWLRRYSVDELPQLWNVLTGSMSLVGPRPQRAFEVDRYEGHARRRLLVKPGITGLWQVNGRSDVSWEEALRLDLYYIEHWSVWLDIILLCRTIAAVVGSRGAY